MVRCNVNYEIHLEKDNELQISLTAAALGTWVDSPLVYEPFDYTRYYMTEKGGEESGDWRVILIPYPFL